MNIKLSLLITLAALGGSMNAETIPHTTKEQADELATLTEIMAKKPSFESIRDRLIRKNKIASEQFSQKLNGIDSLDQDISDETMGLFIRSYLLENMVNCIDYHEKFHHEKTLEGHRFIADLCSDNLSKEILNKEKYTDKQKELALKELKKINQEEEELKLSGFWWVR